MTGAGKGTQTKRISTAFDLASLSSGDALRANITQRTALGLKVQAIISQGGLVNDSIVSDLVFSQLASSLDKGFILDGFPRTLRQAVALDQWMAKKGIQLDIVINLDVPWNVILKRIEDRFIHAQSGRTYSLEYNPPKVSGLDDVTGEPLTKRCDDNVSTFKKRLEAYRSETEPLIAYYKERGLLHNFKGTTSDSIYPLIESKLLHIIQ